MQLYFITGACSLAVHIALREIAEVQACARKNLTRRLDWLQGEIGSRAYLLGGTFTVADAYLFTVLGWAKDVGIDLARWPKLTVYHANLATRPAIRAAFEAEGLA